MPDDLATRIEREELTPELCEEVARFFGWSSSTDTNLTVWKHPRQPNFWPYQAPPYAGSLDAIRAEMPERWRILDISVFPSRAHAYLIAKQSDPMVTVAARANGDPLDAERRATLAAIVRAAEVERANAKRRNPHE